MTKELWGKASVAFFMVFILSGVLYAAEEVTLKGTLKSIDLNAKTVVVRTYDGDDVTVSVEEDRPSLNKLTDGRLELDDDVVVRYINKEGKKFSTWFWQRSRLPLK